MGHVLLVLVLACIWAGDLYAERVTETLVRVREDGRLIEGRIDWTAKQLIVYGEATASKELTDPVQRRLMGFRAAKTAAYRNLFELAGQLRIDAETKVVDAMRSNDMVRTRLNALVQGARVSPGSQHEFATVYRIALQLQLGQAFADAVLPEFPTMRPPPEPTEPLPATEDSVASSDYPLPLPPSPPYTGLLVDARGLDLQPGLAPRILGEDGRQVYGPAFVERGYAAYRGLVGYQKELKQALLDPRLGERRVQPLVVKPLRVAGTYQTDPVIDREDEMRLRLADQQHHFLSQCRVIFLLGPDPERAPMDSTLFELDDVELEGLDDLEEGDDFELPDETGSGDWPE